MNPNDHQTSQRDWLLSSTPQAAHRDWADKSGRLLATSGWAGVLAALGSEPLFAWHPGLASGMVVPVFRRHGLRIGFLGFPVAGGVFDALDEDTVASCAIAIAKQAELDWIRLTQSRQTELCGRVTAARPEVWIDDLQAWSAERDKRLRKDLAYARRSAAGIFLTDRGFDPAVCFQLYAATVARHGGREKYKAGYFAALHDLAADSPLLDFVAALEGGRMRGFAVLAVDGVTASYLHGAVDEQARHQGVTDLLLENLVNRARHAGCTRFSLMASPWEQPGLLKFKRKWGNATGLAITRDFQRGVLGRCLAPIVGWRGRSDRAAAARFLASKAP